MSEISKFLSTAEAAEILKLTPAMVRHLERTGGLFATKIGRGTRLFIRSDVERLARERAARKAAGRGGNARS